MLSYCSTTLPWCNRSPIEFYITDNYKHGYQWLTVTWSCLRHHSEDVYRNKQKANFDRHHRTQVPLIPDNIHMWVATDNGPTFSHVITTAENLDLTLFSDWLASEEISPTWS